MGCGSSKSACAPAPVTAAPAAAGAPKCLLGDEHPSPSAVKKAGTAPRGTDAARAKAEAARQHMEARIREEQGDEGPSWNSFRDAAKVDGRKRVVCVAGLASGSLEARYEGSDHHEVTYCSIKALATQPKRTLESL